MSVFCSTKLTNRTQPQKLYGRSESSSGLINLPLKKYQKADQISSWCSMNSKCITENSVLNATTLSSNKKKKTKRNFAHQIDFQQHNYFILPLTYKLSTFLSHNKWKLFDIENCDKKEIIKGCLNH